MPIEVDLWSTGFRGDIVQRPLVQALEVTERVNQRIVFCGQTPALKDMKALGLPSCETAGTRSFADIPRLVPKILRARRALKSFYAASSSRRIVHVTMTSPWDLFYLGIANRSGAQILLVIHDAQRHIGEESWLMEKIEARLIAKADHLAVLSHYAGDVLRERVGTATPIHIVSPGLVMNANAPGAAKSWPTDRPLRFLFFGRIHAYKGLHILLDAWAQYNANASSPPATLSIVGSGDIEPYRAAIDQAQNIRLRHGWVSEADMAEEFATHDVNVLPYLEGSASATSLAGMWVGMPTIATRIGGFADQLFDRKNALLCNIEASSLSSSMLELARSRSLFESLAIGAHDEAVKLSAPNVAANWISLYEAIQNPR
jgi:glycosyltransferase involved in cell wall biosynthesis